MPEQFDPRIYERFVAPSVPVNQEQINQYSQQSIPVAVPVPEIQAYAPQPQMMQPDPGRIAYNKLIQDRFNQIANKFGGVQHLVENGALETAQRKAAKDVEMYYGAPPAVAKPMTELERIQLEKEKLALEQAQKAFGKVESEQIKIETDKLKSAQENIGLASDVVSSVDRLLANENALQWAGGKTGAILGKFPGETRGIKQQIEQLRDQIGLFGRKAIVGQGQGSISDAEQKMAKEALAQVITDGTDEQLIQSLKAVRQKFGGILDRIQSEASGQPAGQTINQSEGQPKVRTFIPGKGFQD